MDAVSKAGQPHPRPGPAFPSGGGPREARSPPPSGTWGPSSEPHTPARVGGRGCRFTPGDPKRHAVCALAGTGAPASRRGHTALLVQHRQPPPHSRALGCVWVLPFQASHAGVCMQTLPCTYCVPSPLGLPVSGGRQPAWDGPTNTWGPASGNDWDFASQRISGWPSKEKARLAGRHIEARERPGVSGMQTVWSARQQSRRGCRAGRVQPRGKCTVPDRPHASPGGAWVVGWMSSVGEAGLWTGGAHAVLGQLLGDLWPCPPDLRGRGPGGRGCRAHPG